MKKLHTLLGQIPCNGDVGVEIECEGSQISIVDTPFWRTVRDGSLRGTFPYEAAEFVMKSPVLIDQIDEALDDLISRQVDAEFNFSFRTSVHVHVNVQHLTEPEMLAFLYLCLLVEEPLMNFCGEVRKGNRFCLRYADAEGYDQTLDNLFDKGYPRIRQFDGDQIRYAAINIHALRKYGSIEFRGMRGTIDKNVIKHWCETLVHLREYAKELGSPVAIFNKYVSSSNEDFIKEAIGMHAVEFEYANQNQDVERSFSLTIDLPHIYKTRKPIEELQPRAPRREVDPFDVPEQIPQDNREIFRKTNEVYQLWLDMEAVIPLNNKKLKKFMDIYKAIYNAGVENVAEV